MKNNLMKTIKKLESLQKNGKTLKFGVMGGYGGVDAWLQSFDSTGIELGKPPKDIPSDSLKISVAPPKENK